MALKIRAAMHNVVLDLQGINYVYENGVGYNHVLKNISLSIDDGQFVCIVGPSGSGKSTLLNIMGLLDVPTSGAYFFEGVDVSRLDDDSLSLIRALRLGFVFQSFNLLPRDTVISNVEMPLIYQGVTRARRRQRAIEALHSVGLEQDLLARYPSELSGGQMQRVAIARALVNDPAVILADEPTGNLDTAAGARVLSAFTELHNSGKTIILITHDQRIEKWADRVIRIEDGVLCEESNRSGSITKARLYH